MDIISLLSDPKVIIIVLAVAALAVFVYFSWKKTSSSIDALQHDHKRLQKQLAHGVISDEKTNPLRIDNASNMSEETMDYEYDTRRPESTDMDMDAETETEDPESDPDSENMMSGSEPGPKFIDQFSNLVQQHQQHRQHQAHYGMPLLPDTNTIPGHDMIEELRDLKNTGDVIIINDDEYETESEEPIEFHDIDEEPHLPEPVSLMQAHKNELVQQKIQQDIQRMDHENKLFNQRMKAAQAAEERVASSAPAPDSSTSASASASTPKIKVNAKIQPKPKPKAKPKPISVKPKLKTENAPKTKIQPKLKI